MKFSLLLTAASTFSLVLTAALPAPAVAPLHKRHGTDVSHLKYYQYPAALPSGHSLFAPILYHQVQSSQPTRALPGAGGGHFNGDTTTYEVFDFPAEEFAGRQCRFHFLLGPADMGRGYGGVWSVAEEEGDGQSWVDGETTWEGRPRSGALLAEFDVDPVEVRRYRDGDVGAYFVKDAGVFECPVGEKVWEIRAGEGDKDDGRAGRYGNSATWSLNKGLLVERVHMII